jgi:hypothetical protein
LSRFSGDAPGTPCRDALVILNAAISEHARNHFAKQATPTDEAVLGEREACARVADAYARGPYVQKAHGENVAAAIRARSAPGSGVESSDA